MSDTRAYTPGPASGAEVVKEGDDWTLLMVRDLPHAPALVWRALTDPAELRAWAPFDADHSLAQLGPVTLTTVGAPTTQSTVTEVTRADTERALEFSWGDQPMRWALEPHQGGTRLTLWHRIDRRWIAMGAAGWQICFDVLDRHLAADPIGRMVGMETMKFPGWQRLHAEFAEQFGVELPAW